MKKVLLLTLVISMLVSFSAFADVTIEHTFKGEDGFIYHFGTITDLDNPFDAGIKIGDRFFSLNKEDVKDGTNALTKALSEQGKGKFGIGLKDESNILGNTYDVIPYSKADENAQEEYYTAKTITKSEVSEFPEGEPASSDVSITALKINGNYADAVSGTTYYVAVADLDDYEGQITATATDANATVEVSPIADNQATVTVIAEDGVTTGEYTVKFKEMVSKPLTLIKDTVYNVTGYKKLYVSSGTYKLGGSDTFVSTRLSDDLYSTTKQNYVTYAKFSTSDMTNDYVFVGDAVLSGTVNRYSLYDFYNTIYNDINKNDCTFDEFTKDAETFLGSYQYQDPTKSSEQCSVTFDASKLRITPEGYIIIALVDGDNNSKASQFSSDPTLTINYITLD